jgi:hypothetical protein
VRELFPACGSDRRDGAGEQQALAGERVISVDHDFVVGYVSDRIDTALGRVVGTALELHADLDVSGKQIPRFHAHEIGLVLAECVVRLELHPTFIADIVSVERFFDARKNSFVSTVQVAYRPLGTLDQRAVVAEQLIGKRDHRILSDLH